jgi:hypothetical protein
VHSKGEILALLPDSRDVWIMVAEEQTVRSIIREVVNAHYEFTPYYDLIAECFDNGSVEDICDELYGFCETNIEYKEEDEENQTTALPSGILERGYGDCKHYSGFCGGVLDALNRRGRNIDWCYRFASYDWTNKTPHHVFIVVKHNGREIWIDPTPGAKNRKPFYWEDKKINMALKRQIAGLGDVDADEIQMLANISEEELNAALAEVDFTPEMPEEQFNAIALLYNFGVIDLDGNIIVARMGELQNQLPADEYNSVVAAYDLFVSSATLGGFFKDLWRGVKSVALSPMRNAYLGLVAINAFGMASKLARAFEIEGDRNKILDKWYSLGGKKDALTNAVNSGRKKKAILSGVETIGAAAAAPAWLAIAGGIIAAIMPLVSQILKNRNQYSQFEQFDTSQYLQYQNQGGTGNSLSDWMRDNPLIVFGGGALLLYLLMSKDND